MPQINIYCSKELKQAIDAAAKSKEWTAAHYARIAVKEKLARDAKPPKKGR